MSHFCVYVFHDKNTSINTLLAPYDENLVVEPYVEYTKEEAIAKVRENIEDFKNGDYAEYLKNPEEYEKKYGYMKSYMEYLKNEFPQKLNWTDDQCYEYIKSLYNSSMIDKDGNILSNYNPKSKWDWYTVGGRWSGGIPMKTNTKLEIKSCNECKVSQIDMDKIGTPYAYVDTNGNWYGRGEMGWFGASSNDKDEKSWNDEFKKFINNQKKSTIVTLVDCHI